MATVGHLLRENGERAAETVRCTMSSTHALFLFENTK